MSNVLITGTSSGIGRATALELARAGHKVYATMRDPGRAPELGEQALAEGLPISILTMDVDSDRSVSDCFAAVRQSAPIDILVNNAGIERHGSVEELPMEAFRAIMETNYFGTLRCIREILPAMRERRSGCIINVTSVAGKISGSPLGAYGASKFALEGLTEALAGEVKPFGVRVAIVQPGIIDTPMARAIEDQPLFSPYRQGNHMAALFRAALEHPTPPSVVAEVIKDVIESGTWKLRHPAGPDAEPFLAWRAAMTDEQWIDFNALDSAAYRERVKRDFGLELDIPDQDSRAHHATAD